MAAQQEAGLKVEKNRGFSGKGYKFNDEEAMMHDERKQLQKFQLGKFSAWQVFSLVSFQPGTFLALQTFSLVCSHVMGTFVTLFSLYSVTYRSCHFPYGF